MKRIKFGVVQDQPVKTVALLFMAVLAVTAEDATVYIYRLRVFAASARKMTFSIDGTSLAQLQNGNEAVLLARSVLLKDPLYAGVPWGYVEVEVMEPKVVHRVNLMAALAWMNSRSGSPRLMALKSRLQQLQNV